MKGFSTVRDTQRGSQSYMKKRRGRREIEVSRRRKGGFKRRETDLGCTLFPKCSLQPRAPREIHRIGLRREGGGRKQRLSGGEKVSQKGERVIIILLSKNGYRILDS